MRLKYTGPFAEVEIPDLGVVVARGETFEATGDFAQSLLKQADNFERVKAPKKAAAKKTAPPEPKPDQPVEPDSEGA